MTSDEIYKGPYWSEGNMYIWFATVNHTDNLVIPSGEYCVVIDKDTLLKNPAQIHLYRKLPPEEADRIAQESSELALKSVFIKVR